MTHYALNSTARGVTAASIHDREVIVTVASYGHRRKQVAYAIESVMQGTLKPNRIVLNMPESCKDDPLPVLLQKQQERGLEINYCKDLRSYNKIIHVLRENPDAYIVTIDDDAIYNQDLLERLVQESRQYPNDVCAMRVHRITLDQRGRAKTYRSWVRRSKTTDASTRNFPTGVGGVLYPPHCFAPEVFDESTFGSVCKFADDTWLYAMAIKHGTLIRKVHSYETNSEEYALNPYLDDGLERHNVKQHGNDVQFNAVFEKYNLYESL